MNMDRIRITLVAALCAVSVLAAQTTATKKPAKASSSNTASPKAETKRDTPAPMLLPSQQQVDAALRRTLGYDQGLSWNILDIKPSEIPGVADVVVSMNKQNPIHFYVSPDSQKAIVGTMMPFGANPYEANREKLKAADGPAKG